MNKENSPLDVQFGPNDLLSADAYILAVINNQYLDDLAELNSWEAPSFLMSKIPHWQME